MRRTKAFLEHSGKAVQSDERFEHVMALALNPKDEWKSGIIRCIVSREGSVESRGYVDKSQLFNVRGESLDFFVITDRLEMKNEREIFEHIISQMDKNGGAWEYLGHEDPDIWVDDETGLVHVYFTMPFLKREEKKMLIHLGHAVGKDVESLEMTLPVLLHVNDTEKESGVLNVAKEVSIAPMNTKGLRYNLIESADIQNGVWYSTVRRVVVHDMGKEWKAGDVLFHPLEGGISWASEHASPGPLFPKSFIDVGKGKSLGVMNGREASDRSGDTIIYRHFSPGLFIYNYEEGKIEWVSPEPLLRDSEAKTITFASDFVYTGNGIGILYAHVDDSFVRAYTLNARAIRTLLPKNFQEKNK